MLRFLLLVAAFSQLYIGETSSSSSLSMVPIKTEHSFATDRPELALNFCPLQPPFQQTIRLEWHVTLPDSSTSSKTAIVNWDGGYRGQNMWTTFSVRAVHLRNPILCLFLVLPETSKLINSTIYLCDENSHIENITASVRGPADQSLWFAGDGKRKGPCWAGSGAPAAEVSRSTDALSPAPANAITGIDTASSDTKTASTLDSVSTSHGSNQGNGALGSSWLKWLLIIPTLLVGVIVAVSIQVVRRVCRATVSRLLVNFRSRAKQKADDTVALHPIPPPPPHQWQRCNSLPNISSSV